MTPIRLLLVDDHPLVRDGLRARLDLPSAAALVRYAVERRWTKP